MSYQIPWEGLWFLYAPYPFRFEGPLSVLSLYSFAIFTLSAIPDGTLICISSAGYADVVVNLHLAVLAEISMPIGMQFSAILALTNFFDVVVTLVAKQCVEYISSSSDWMSVNAHMSS